MDFPNKTFLVLGAGISGIGAARALAKVGAKAVLSDTKPLPSEQVAALEKMGVKCFFGVQDRNLLANHDYLVLSPGIPLTTPMVVYAKEDGIPVIAELELAFHLSKAPIYAVTGTNGKTTTTTLFDKIMAEAGISHVTGGNIGIALSELVTDVSAEGIIIAEVSSFQLESIDLFRPKAAVILNITPDHFERHGTMAEYIKVKSRVFENQKPGDVLLLNRQDEFCCKLAQMAKSDVYWLDTETKPERGAYIEGEMLFLRINGKDIPLLTTSELRLKGRHNYENVLAAAFLSYFGGVPTETICKVLRTFKGLEHRIEFVTEKYGISYYNDSKATNTDATIKAIESFREDIVLIAGGYDKGTDLADLMKTAQHCRAVVFIGAARERFTKSAKAMGIKNIYTAETLQDAVQIAGTAAKTHAAEIVLFSPACSSYDMFSNYCARGLAFKEIVRALGE